MMRSIIVCVHYFGCWEDEKPPVFSALPPRLWAGCAATREKSWSKALVHASHNLEQRGLSLEEFKPGANAADRQRVSAVG